MNKNPGKGERVIVLGVVFQLRLQGWKHPMIKLGKQAACMNAPKKKST